MAARLAETLLIIGRWRVSLRRFDDFSCFSRTKSSCKTHEEAHEYTRSDSFEKKCDFPKKVPRSSEDLSALGTSVCREP